MNAIIEAKKKFWDYACTHFYMAHDGLDSEYRKYCVSPEQESIWRSEYIEYWSGQLTGSDLLALQKLADAGAFEALPQLLETANQGDSYAAYRFACLIWDLAGFRADDPALRSLARQTSLQIWSDLCNQMVQLTDDHRRLLSQIDPAANHKTPEEVLRELTRHKIQTAETQQHNYPDD